MGIKWNNICPVVSGATNEILFCKGKKVFKNNKLLFTEKNTIKIANFRNKCNTTSGLRRSVQNRF